MRALQRSFILAAAGWLAVLPLPSFAAGYLKIGDIKGESIEVSSYSWGMSNSSAAVASPRDAASGLPTGKRQHKPVTIIASAEPVIGAENTLSVVLPESGGDAVEALLKMCGTGQSLTSMELGDGRKRYQLRNVIVTSCATEGGQRTVTMKTGHVTLMK